MEFLPKTVFVNGSLLDVWMVFEFPYAKSWFILFKKVMIMVKVYKELIVNLKTELSYSKQLILLNIREYSKAQR